MNALGVGRWCPGTELNRRRQPFQGCALPTELPGHPAALAPAPLGPKPGKYSESPSPIQASWKPTWRTSSGPDARIGTDRWRRGGPTSSVVISVLDPGAHFVERVGKRPAPAPQGAASPERHVAQREEGTHGAPDGGFPLECQCSQDGQSH